MLPAPLLLFCLLSPLLATPALALTAEETAVTAAVDRSVARYTQVLERAVNINSGSMNFDGVRQVGELFAGEFRDLGFQASWVDGEPFGRAGHLVASYGERGPKVLLIGHLDTVFASDSAFQRFERVDEHHVRGPGITDMKGGNVVMLLALSALREAGVLDELQLKVVLTGDEELRGKPLALANAALVDAAVWADIAIGFEDGDGDPATAVITRRGASSWRLEVSGKPAHSSQVFREDIGDGAAFELARILSAWREALREEENLTFNPGALVAGTDVTLDPASGRGTVFGKSNVIARSALVNGGIRAASPQQLERALRVMRAIAADNSPHTSADFQFSEGYPPMPATDGNRKLLSLYTAISEELGYGPVAAVDPRRAGAADISFAAAHVDMAIDGLGLMGEGGHTVDEAADMRTLPMQAIRAAILLLRLSRQQAE
ncbi:M20/M25/M40 family metallo-hydrolase [Parahaliea aestuarii]|uniref:M20 family metallopeptidase n=1 Tax=Parahaliea aestuarii TaxID=1852021 RepID=A0A5C9A0M7_9GAMM|nr:M20/M25/M40 family metallo-hydrolase [Parahaliea aestuarii]TXS93330.1 M20 family metallopeptidase [Parahaliea aestuarii]